MPGAIALGKKVKLDFLTKGDGNCGPTAIIQQLARPDVAGMMGVHIPPSTSSYQQRQMVVNNLVSSPRPEVQSFLETAQIATVSDYEETHPNEIVDYNNPTVIR